MNGNIPYDAYVQSVAVDRTWLDASILFVLAVHYAVDICIWQEDQDLRGWGPFVAMTEVCREAACFAMVLFTIVDRLVFRAKLDFDLSYIVRMRSSFIPIPLQVSCWSCCSSAPKAKVGAEEGISGEGKKDGRTERTDGRKGGNTERRTECALVSDHLREIVFECCLPGLIIRVRIVGCGVYTQDLPPRLPTI